LSSFNLFKRKKINLVSIINNINLQQRRKTASRFLISALEKETNAN